MNAIREALADSLKASIPGTQISPYVLANTTMPSIDIIPDETIYDLALQRGFDMAHFRIRVYVGLTTDIGAQKLLGRYLSPTGDYSVKVAAELDPQLGGLVDDVRVVSGGAQLTFVNESGQPTLGSQWTTRVYWSN